VQAHLKRNVCSRVVCHDLSDLPNITVSVLALVRAETPVRHHGRQARKSRVLSRDFLRTRSSKEIEIENSAKSVVLEVLAFGVVDFDIHTLGAR
jgi:hypothetical protein